jgi:putative DNA primase/helicase
MWDRARWARDNRLRVFSLAQEHCRNIAKSVEKHQTAAQLTKAEKRAALVSLARENPALTMVPDDWDADPWLLGTPGGTVDLRTGQLLPPDPLQYVTMITAAVPNGNCPLWRETLYQICDESAAVVGFLKRWFGYCLTGLTREEKLLFFLGDGGNGKGTVIETIAHIMGDYAVVVAMTTLVQTRYQEHEGVT